MRKKSIKNWRTFLIVLLIILSLFFYFKMEFNPNSTEHIPQKDSYKLNKESLDKNIPLLNYSCLSIFPSKILVNDAVWNEGWEVKLNNFTNDLKLNFNCKRDSSEGGNINVYNCKAGFLVSQYSLPDGTIIKEHYFTTYYFILDRRNCSENICIPSSVFCEYEKWEVGEWGFTKPLDERLRYFSHINLNVLDCDGCLGSDGKCYPIGSTYMGKTCVE